jgi:hypothetical protein
MATQMRIGMGFGVLALIAATGCTQQKAAQRDDAEPSKPAPSLNASPPAATAAPAGQAQSPAAAAAAAPEGAHAKRGRAEPTPADRPGLGTEWGESRSSHISTVSFERADRTSPFAMASLFYNDERGARALADSSGFRRTVSGSVPIANGAFTVGLRDERGHFLSGYAANGKDFVVGESGQRYTIVLKNETDVRFEVVVSVDGLDVMDGKSASVGKRGYIVDPRAELEVDGFRQSEESVAAFRFGSVKSSYANQKHGDTRNVGVIGVAVFHERGTNPFAWANNDVARRREANPFPAKFASPP